MGKKNKDFYVSVMSECIKSTYEWWGTDIMSMYSMIEKGFLMQQKQFIKCMLS